MWLIPAFIAGIAAGALIAIPFWRRHLARFEARIREAERRARDAERLAELGTMTGGLAHEIKNPLSTVLLNGDLLREGLDDADMPAAQRDRLRKRLDSLLREVERLRGILTDFLRFAGRIRLDPQVQDVGVLIEELCDFFLPQCTQAGVTLRCDPPGTPAVAAVDAALLKQAILNLMINALQAMSGAPADGAARSLTVSVGPSPDGVRLRICDTGPGIPPERLPEIFRPYVSFRSGGTGLGLPTARRIIEEHGGRIEVHSEPGRGCEFIVTLPPAAPA
ncbi:MAG: hypothetical protein KF817_09780 [Phycisphaeraceae bacterium]|nr:hypothetical protein [Phycisphaeraceae bacterium]